MSEKFVLRRSGACPLEFAGQQIAEADSRGRSGPAQNRWHTITIYQTTGGKHVLHIGFRSIWQGEQDYDTVTVHDTPASLVAAATSYNPLDHWQGYPPQPHYAERQARIEAAIGTSWRNTVADTLSHAGYTETIE